VSSTSNWAIGDADLLTRGTLIYIGQRIVLIAFTVLAVSSIVFLGIHRLPGDALFNEHLHGTQYELLLHHYGLDRPLWDQYTSFLSGLFLRGNLGESLVNRGVPLTPLVLRELTVSVEVGLFALIFTIGLGMLLGVVAAIRQNTWIDYLLSTTNLGQAPWPEDDQDDHEQDGDVAPVDAERRRWLDW
jgi:oligopeptide transport system permease protein